MAAEISPGKLAARKYPAEKKRFIFLRPFFFAANSPWQISAVILTATFFHRLVPENTWNYYHYNNMCNNLS